MIKRDISKILKSARKDEGLTVKKLAEKLNMSETIIYEWESGRKQPSIDSICELADIYKVTTDYLLGRKDY